MFTKLKIRTRLAIVVLVPLLALGAIAALGYRTLYSSRIGSRSYDNIVLAKDLGADVSSPGQYLIESYALALELVDETDPAAVETGVALLGEQQAAYEQRHAYWEEQLRDESDEAKTELLVASYSYALQFFDALDTQFIPALGAGDGEAARAALDGPVGSAYRDHRASVERVAELAGGRVEFFESYADDLVRDRTLQLIAALAAIVVLIVVVSVLIARSIVRPVRRLTAAARDAEIALPGVVAAAHTEGETPIALAPIEAGTGGELASLAAAMTQMQSTAVQLATEQAITRKNVSTMLANLARRNQSLLNRTLSFISKLEEDERDPETLDNLFKLDHLATRMRRNAESLLVLAGSDPPRTWPRPIEVTEVIRAALSEIEAYDRVELNQIEPTWIRGSIVSDLTHLLAELLDNATRFSPPTAQVSIVGKLTEKGYLLSVIDSGMGMTPPDLEKANAELASIGRVEERSTMVLGLAVVGRLAARSGIHVRLAESPFEGVTAQVRVPFELLQVPAAEPSSTAQSADGLEQRRPGQSNGTATPSAATAADPVAAALAAVAAATSTVRAPLPLPPPARPLPRRPSLLRSRSPRLRPLRQPRRCLRRTSQRPHR